MASRSRLGYYAPSALLVRNAMLKGLFGDNRVWKIVGIAVLVSRGVKKLSSPGPRTVAVEQIKIGESIVLRGVRSRKPPTS